MSSDVRQMTEDEINSPVSWHCVDCSVNTAPGLSTRAELYKAFVVEGRESAVQRYDSNTEVYIVRDAVWARAGMEPFGGCLCIGCLEARIGRKLKPKDFNHSSALNSPRIPGTRRLLDRQGRRKGTL